MKTPRLPWRIARLGLTLLLALLLAAQAYAAPPPSSAPGAASIYAIDWDVTGASGGLSAGGNILLRDAINQPAAGVSSGGGITLEDGYAPAAPPPEHHIYLPILRR